MTLFIPTLMHHDEFGHLGIVRDVELGQWAELRYVCPKAPGRNRCGLYDMRTLPPPHLHSTISSSSSSRATVEETEEEYQQSLTRIAESVAIQTALTIYTQYYKEALPLGNILFGVDTETWDANVDRAARETLGRIPVTKKRVRLKAESEFEWYKSRRLLLLTLATLGQMHRNGCPMAALLDLIFPALQKEEAAAAAPETSWSREEEEEEDDSTTPQRRKRSRATSRAILAQATPGTADANTWFYPAETFLSEWSADASLRESTFVRRASAPRIIPLQFFPLVLYASQGILSALNMNEYRLQWDLRNNPSRAIDDLQGVIRRRLNILEMQTANALSFNGHPVNDAERKKWTSLARMEDTILPKMADFIRLSYIPNGTGWLHGSYAAWRMAMSRLATVETQLSQLLAERDTQKTGNAPHQLMQTLLQVTASKEGLLSSSQSPMPLPPPTKKRKITRADEDEAMGDDYISGRLKPEEERHLAEDFGVRLKRVEDILNTLLRRQQQPADENDTTSIVVSV